MNTLLLFISLSVFSTPVLAAQCQPEYMFTASQTQAKTGKTVDSTLYIGKDSIDLTFKEGDRIPHTFTMNLRTGLLNSTPANKKITCNSENIELCGNRALGAFKSKFDQVLKEVTDTASKQCAQEHFKRMSGIFRLKKKAERLQRLGLHAETE